MTDHNTTLFVATRHRPLLTRAGEVARALDLTLESADAAEALIDPSKHRRGLVLLDLALAQAGQGTGLLRAFARSPYSAPVLAHLHHVTVPTVIEAMQAGARDVVGTDVSAAGLIRTVLSSLAIEAERFPVRQAIREARRRFSCLSPRERQVLRKVIEGKRNKEVAHELGIRENTVEVHRAHAMRKLGTRNGVELARNLFLCELEGDAEAPLDGDRLLRRVS